MRDREFGDDWQNSLVCPDCHAVPCRCSLVTRLLERVSLALTSYLTRRYRASQAQLSK